MKKRNIQLVLDSMRKIAEEKYPEKETPEEQFRAYGKIGLLMYCERRGWDFNKYLDLFEEFTASA